MSLAAETVPILAAHAFDEAALAGYMERYVAGFRGPLDVRQFQGGMSNPTFLLTDGNGEQYVMRRKPPGKLLPSAHAVDREYKVITALGPTDVPVARTHALCEDESVIGVAFYIMDFVEGRVFRHYDLPDMAPAERAAIYDAMNDTLAKLHSVDYAAVGLGDFGRVGGYIQRQVNRWSKQYAATKTDEVPAMDNLIAWLPANIPDADETTIVHGDYRLENMIFHPTEPRVLAVIDWELSTLGHPLSDLAYNCLTYHTIDQHRGDITSLDYASYGIPSEADYVAAYCRRTGRAGIDDWTFYMVLSLFRMSAIVQGVYYRGIKGNAASPEAVERGAKARYFAEVAWSLVER